MKRSKPSDPKTYTKPELRDHIKEEIIASDKGGNPGQWSARKAQLVAQEYEKEGGAYKKPPSKTQKSLEQWSEEKWTTSDHKKARRTGGTARYLPEKAWDQLSPDERSATNKKKREGSQKGEQFVSNTPAAASARKRASKSVAAENSHATTKKQSAKESTAPSKRKAKP